MSYRRGYRVGRETWALEAGGVGREEEEEGEGRHGRITLNTPAWDGALATKT